MCMYLVVAVPTSGRSTTGRRVVRNLCRASYPSLYTSVHDWMSNNKQWSVNAATACRHAVVAQTHEVNILVAVTSSVEDPSTGTPQTSRLPPVKRVRKCCPLNSSPTGFQKPIHHFRLHTHHGSPSSRCTEPKIRRAALNPRFITKFSTSLLLL